MNKYDVIQLADLYDYLALCIKEALKSKCHRSRCGSIVVGKFSTDERPLGTGFNSHPGNCEGACIKDSLPADFKSDRTCCVHAEQRAIMNALENGFVGAIKHAAIYFIRLDDDGKPLAAGDPYCTICSKMALDVGIKLFCLWDGKLWQCYDTVYYNELSFKYVKPKS